MNGERSPDSYRIHISNKQEMKKPKYVDTIYNIDRRHGNAEMVRQIVESEAEKYEDVE